MLVQRDDHTSFSHGSSRNTREGCDSVNNSACHAHGLILQFAPLEEAPALRQSVGILAPPFIVHHSWTMSSLWPRTLPTQAGLTRVVPLLSTPLLSFCLTPHHETSLLSSLRRPLSPRHRRHGESQRRRVQPTASSIPQASEPGLRSEACFSGHGHAHVPCCSEPRGVCPGCNADSP